MNSVTHGFGVLLCALGMSALCGKAAAQGRFYVPVAVYSASLLVLYSASTVCTKIY
jgi:channel protein (hemolysin III family)